MTPRAEKARCPKAYYPEIGLSIAVLANVRNEVVAEISKEMMARAACGLAPPTDLPLTPEPRAGYAGGYLVERAG